MSGQWRPEWDDPEDGHSDAGLPEVYPDGGYSELELSEVTSFLGSVRSPVLPSAFEARISAAIAAEAAARAASVPGYATEEVVAAAAAARTDDAKDTVRSDNSKEFSPAATASETETPGILRPREVSRRPRGRADASGPGRRRRRLPMLSGEAASWVLVCFLVLGGIGFLVSRGGGSSSSSSAAIAAGSAAQPASSSAQSALNKQSIKPEAEHGITEPSASASAGGAAGVLYVASGTSYQRSTLARQVGSVLAQRFAAGSGSASATAPVSSSASAPPSNEPSAASSSTSSAASGPSATLNGCVSRVTGGAMPTLVDKARYEGTPAYIIATATRVWVVGLECSAAHPHVITSAPLNG